MNRIRLLPEHVANQIAAGEVVERPASVVKELVENALDARATRITVEIQAGGRSLVRVSDDGIGMNRDDALLCLERHATSKIQDAADLSAINTMGFRGEALPSIASVSRFTLTSRERESTSPEGTQVIIHGGKMIEVKAAGGATGTTIEVRQLFYNLPARRKFLRTEETETSHIQHYLTLAALAAPEVAWHFIRDGRTIWQFPAVTSGKQSDALRERLRAVYGDGIKWLPLEFKGTLPPVEQADGPNERVIIHASPLRLWGFVGAPGVSRSTREEQNVFVNRRPVDNRGINYALIEGYHTALMKGRYPVCCLFLEVDPSEVDVNIHPAKREVKFHRERAVRGLVTQAVRETLLAFHSVPAVASAPARPVAQPSAERPQELPQFPQTPFRATAPVVPKIPWPSREAPAPSEPARPLVPPTAPTTHVSEGPVPLLQIPLRVVGVVGCLYVVLESDRGMVLLDQHAAHERILYEQMLNRLEEAGQCPSQRLLLPETVELSARDSQFLREQMAALTRLGVGLSEFGERTFLLDALPPFVKSKDPRRFMTELLDELKSAGQTVNTLRLGEHVIAKTVCRHAIKANDPLSGPELENLVNDLRQCDMPYTCPHGRPTLIEMNFRELEKKFGRAQ